MADISHCNQRMCDRKHMPLCVVCVTDIRADERAQLSKLFALNHVPCDNPNCLCQSKEFEEYWKGAGIEKRAYIEKG